MANILISLIAKLSGFENLEQCLDLCEIVEFSQLISINDKMLDGIELYLQKKCSKMSLGERNKYIGNAFANYPDKFKFGPAVRQRILMAAEQFDKIFNNPAFPITIGNVKNLCDKILLNNKRTITSISVESLKNITETNSIPINNNHNIPLQSIINNSREKSKKPGNSDANDTHISKSNLSRENYPNIFQRMDSLRRGEIESLNKVGNDNVNIPSVSDMKSFPFQNDSILDKENINENQENKERSSITTRSQRLINKRNLINELKYVDQDDEPQKKIRKMNKKKAERNLPKSQKKSNVDIDSPENVDTDKSIKYSSNAASKRSRSQRLIDKCNLMKARMALMNSKTEKDQPRSDIKEAGPNLTLPDANKDKLNIVKKATLSSKLIQDKRALPNDIPSINSTNTVLPVNQQKMIFKLPRVPTEQTQSADNQTQVRQITFTNQHGKQLSIPESEIPLHISHIASLHPHKAINIALVRQNLHPTINVNTKNPQGEMIPESAPNQNKSSVPTITTRILDNQFPNIEAQKTTHRRLKWSNCLFQSPRALQNMPNNPNSQVPGQKCAQVVVTKLTSASKLSANSQPVNHNKGLAGIGNFNYNVVNQPPTKQMQPLSNKPIYNKKNRVEFIDKRVKVQPSGTNLVNANRDIQNNVQTARQINRPILTSELINANTKLVPIPNPVDDAIYDFNITNKKSDAAILNNPKKPVFHTPDHINHKPNEKQPLVQGAQPEIYFKPQWTSTPNFISNRFINSTKHQKPVLKMDNIRVDISSVPTSSRL